MATAFVVGALDLARAGGRLAGGVADPRPGGPVPVLRLVDGKITAIGEARRSDEAAELMAAEILTAGDRLRIGIGVADAASGLVGADLRRRLELAHRDLELIDYRVGPSVGAHTGPFGVRFGQPLRWWVLAEDGECVALAWWVRARSPTPTASYFSRKAQMPAAS